MLGDVVTPELFPLLCAAYMNNNELFAAECPELFLRKVLVGGDNPCRVLTDDSLWRMHVAVAVGVSEARKMRRVEG